MNLFSESKAIFLKIANIILLVWLLIALVMCYTNIVTLVMPEPLQTYAEYQNDACSYFEKTITDAEKDKQCAEQYGSYKIERTRSIYYNKRSLVIDIGNIIIIGATMIFINRKKKIN